MASVSTPTLFKRPATSAVWSNALENVMQAFAARNAAAGAVDRENDRRNAVILGKRRDRLMQLAVFENDPADRYPSDVLAGRRDAAPADGNPSREHERRD